ncbi:1,6-anhydro-N-acetylmuramyl-L-alanine amidase AmpD [Leeia sp. TBRC 13508]|uniref:1,6-anhydro-N-acetylmuramyl-L-alanine amidase AmpD n=1 Tax=Leeia speluncae TaxID=2884804 RepID=A0ABS8D5P1_9NEIS|nr:1,6-anhydro-N-acetylmuramyl-L-alanine amidase AmpD [Leeia speluncae]MCB6183525.1 1,6-anhydro-N-acetylmuramyl-L-alanine amidase AmpD [Leeia speluncae]
MEKSFHFNELGWCDSAIQIPSPNTDARPDSVDASLLVIHNISLPPNEYGGNGVIALFTNQLNPSEHPYYEGIAHLRVSAHFFIRRTGELVQFVPITQRAWHAGISRWGEKERCNDFSIGIELEGSDFEVFTDTQYQTLSQLAIALKAALPTLLEVTGHSHIAPGRKTDPGPYFNWASLIGEGGAFAGKSPEQPNSNSEAS